MGNRTTCLRLHNKEDCPANVCGTVPNCPNSVVSIAAHGTADLLLAGSLSGLAHANITVLWSHNLRMAFQLPLGPHSLVQEADLYSDHVDINGANYGEVIAAPSHDETSDAPVMMFGGNDGSPLVARSILKKIANHNVEGLREKLTKHPEQKEYCVSLGAIPSLFALFYVAARGLYTPLQYAARTDLTGEVIRALLDLGCQVSDVGSLQASPLHIASRAGNVAGLIQLLKNSSTSDLRIIDGAGNLAEHVAINDDIKAALHKAMADGSVEVGIRHLLSKFPATQRNVNESPIDVNDGSTLEPTSPFDAGSDAATWQWVEHTEKHQPDNSAGKRTSALPLLMRPAIIQSAELQSPHNHLPTTVRSARAASDGSPCSRVAEDSFSHSDDLDIGDDQGDKLDTPENERELAATARDDEERDYRLLLAAGASPRVSGADNQLLPRSPLKRTPSWMEYMLWPFSRRQYSTSSLGLDQLVSEDDTNVMTFGFIPFEQLKIGEKVGSGASGVVSKGFWRNLLVAIKKFTNANRRSDPGLDFRHEIRMCTILCECKHPNIITFLGACIRGDECFMCTEFAAFGSLYSQLHKEDAISYNFVTARRWAIEIASGMAFLHSKHILHRDLKSANILLSSSKLHLNETTVGDEPNVVEMVCKLCDFGVSDEFHGTSSEEIRGSIRWMCKEALRQEHAEASHDVYSYGACLYEICARRVPFMRIKDDMRVFMLICSEGAELTVPPFLPAEFANVVRSCLLEASARPSFEVLLAQLHRTVFHFGRQLDLTTNISVLEQDVLATSTLREQQRSWEPPSYL